MTWWRHITRRPPAARFAANRVRMGKGLVWAKTTTGWARKLGWPACGAPAKCKYYHSNLGARTLLYALAAAIKARWVREQGRQ